MMAPSTKPHAGSTVREAPQRSQAALPSTAPRPATTNILVVDDLPAYRTSFSRMLAMRGYHVELCGSGREALEILDREPIDAILTDLVMPEMDGIDFVRRVRERHGGLPIVAVSGAADAELALRAIRAGASDFLEKPVYEDRLVVTLENALRYAALAESHRQLARETGTTESMAGDTEPMRKLRAMVERVGPTESRVLVLGENGTGKELVARAIHRASPRAHGPFVKLNCAAVPADLVESELFGHERGAFTGAVAVRRGRFEQACGGTLFLDEIGDMPAAMQAKLLRVVQEGQLERVGGQRTIDVDVRMIAATNRDLEAMVETGDFREDLFYRLAVVTLRTPPLRARRADVPLLATRFAEAVTQQTGRRIQLEPDALEALCNHAWPGNVRELQNLIERLSILADEGTVTASDVREHLPSARVRTHDDDDLWRPDVPLRDLLEVAERKILAAALRAHGGNKSATARTLRIERSHFHKKLKRHGLDGDEPMASDAEPRDARSSAG